MRNKELNSLQIEKGLQTNRVHHFIPVRQKIERIKITSESRKI